MSSPLVITLKRLVIAVDPESGRERWRQTLPAPVGRIFLVARRLYVAYGGGVESRIACFDYEAGTPIGTIGVGFEVTAGFVKDDRLLFVSGRGGVACLTLDGGLMWNAHTKPQGIGALRYGDAETLTATAGSNVLWSAEVMDQEDANHNAGLLLDGLCAQPDL